MSLTNELKNFSKTPPSKDVDLTAETKNQLMKVVHNLSDKAFKALETGDVKIQDTKDIKDVVTMFQLLNQEADIGNSATPQVNAQMVNFYSGTFKTGDEAPKPVDIDKTLDNMSANDIKKMVNDQAKELNDNNADTF